MRNFNNKFNNKKLLTATLIIFFFNLLLFFILPLSILNSNNYYRFVVKDISKSQINASPFKNIDYKNQDEFNNKFNQDLLYWVDVAKSYNDFLCVKRNGEDATVNCGEYVTIFSSDIYEYQVTFCSVINYKKNGELYDPTTMLSVYNKYGTLIKNIALGLFTVVFVIDLMGFVYLQDKNYLYNLRKI